MYQKINFFKIQKRLSVYNIDQIGINERGRFLPTYQNKEGKFLTLLGEILRIDFFSWNFSSNPEKDLKQWHNKNDVPSGYHWVRHGGASVGGASLVPIDLRPEDICRIRKMMENADK